MKQIKNLIVAAVLCQSVLLSAQVVQPVTATPQPANPTALFPNQGAFMFEVNLKPFSGGDVISINNFQAKYRISSQTALRLGLYIDNKTTKQLKDDYDFKEKYPRTVDQKSFTYGILPGIEYHFLKNSKISPYCGVELSYMKQNAQSTYEIYNYSYNGYNTDYTYTKYKVDGGWISGLSGNSITVGQRAYHTFGTNLLLGTDFYFVKNMYFGFEVGLSYSHSYYDKATVDQTNVVDKITIPSYNSSELKFYSNSAIRLGVWF